MYNNIKQQLYNFLVTELDSAKTELNCFDIELIYSGHGWDEDVIVLCLDSKDYLISSSGAHIKLNCPDCNFNLNSDGDHVIDDISNRLSVHKCLTK